MTLQPAKDLSQILRAFTPKPLSSPEEMAAFYRDEINQARSKIPIRKRLVLSLRQSLGGAYYKGLIMGSPGVGKTTELNKLIMDIQGHYSYLYFSVLQSLDGRNFKATDVLLLMMISLVEKTQEPVDRGGAGSHPRSDLLTGIWKWFQVEKEIFKEQTLVGLDMSAGVDISPEAIWAKLLGLFARLKGEFKFSSNRNIEVEQYRLKRVDELLDLMNQLLEECTQRLKDATGKEWLFIGDDFEKPAISLIRNEDFFIGNRIILQQLNAHFLFSIPVDLAAKAVLLPVSSDQILLVPETPVYQPDDTPNRKGRDALAAVLQARMDLTLFASGQMERIIVASGGIMRILFALVTRAASTAQLQDPPRDQIEAEDVEDAIQVQREEFLRALGRISTDPQEFTQEKRIERLKQIYGKDLEAQIPDELHYFLAQRQLLIESNGTRWVSVHPVAVDILASLKEIQPDQNGVINGGLI